MWNRYILETAIKLISFLPILSHFYTRYLLIIGIKITVMHVKQNVEPRRFTNTATFVHQTITRNYSNRYAQSEPGNLQLW